MASKDEPDTLPATAAGDLVHDATALAPAGSAAPSQSGIEALPTVHDEAYARRGEIARGGLGRIIEATDRRLKRVVALKELRRHTPEAAARFVREALVTARLQHPGIVPIYEAGRWGGDGEPFYSMKLVSGTSLADAIAARTTLDERLGLVPRVTAVVDTIAYAHAQGVIHRDLKPHNVMCGEFGETVVIDWGLAKERGAVEEERRAGPGAGTGTGTGSGSGSQSSETVAGTVMGTPAYMPPEQARGQLVDERADVYALGAMLYHVLAGTPPYRGDGESGVLAGPPPALESLAAGVPRDLVAIVTKAMAREPSDRYPSARELAEDLRRFQTGRLVSVREYTAAERLARWLRRYRATVAVAVVALIVLAVISAFSFARVVRERDRASAEAEVAQRAQARAETRDGDLTLLQARGQLDRDPTATLEWLKQLGDDRLNANTASVAADAVSRGVASHVLRLDEGRISGLVLGAGGRGFALGQQGKLYAFDTATGKSSLAWSGEPSTALAITPDGGVVAFGTTHAVIVIAGGKLETYPLDATAISVAIDSRGALLAIGLLDGRLLVRPRTPGASGASGASGTGGASGAGGASGTSGAGDASGAGGASGAGVPSATGGGTELDKFSREARMVAFSPDDKLLAAVAFDGTVVVYRVADHARVLRAAVHTSVWSVAWAPDGSAIATACDDGSAQLWPLDGRARTDLVGHTGAVLHIAFDARGERIAAASRDHSVIVWTRDGHAVARLAHDGEVHRVVALADGGWASSGGDHLIHRWNHDGELVAVLRGHDEFVPMLALSPDGAVLASGGQDGSIRLWPTARDEQLLEPTGATVLAIARSNATVATVRAGRAYLRAASAMSGSSSSVSGPPSPVSGPSSSVSGPSSSVSGPPSAVSGTSGVSGPSGVPGPSGVSGPLGVSGTPAVSGPPGVSGTPGVSGPSGDIAPATELGAADGIGRLFVVDDKLVFGLGNGGKVIRYSNGAARSLVSAPTDLGGLTEQAGVVFGAGYDGKLYRWTDLSAAPTGLPADSTYVLTVVRVPDGELVASGGADGTVRLWHPDGRVERVLGGKGGPVHHVVVSPDGKLIASGDIIGDVIVWRISDGAEVAHYKHVGAVQALAFSPASDVIASTGDDRSVQVERVSADANGGRDPAGRRAPDIGRSPVAGHLVLSGHLQSATSVAFSPDGTLVASGAVDGAVRIWDLETRASRVVRGHRGAVRALAFESGGALVTGGDDNRALRWPAAAIAPPPAAATAQRAWIAARTDATVLP